LIDDPCALKGCIPKGTRLSGTADPARQAANRGSQALYGILTRVEPFH